MGGIINAVISGQLDEGPKALHQGLGEGKGIGVRVLRQQR